MFTRFLTVLLVSTLPFGLTAEEMEGMQKHYIQEWYFHEPCTKIINTIDFGPNEQEARERSFRAMEAAIVLKNAGLDEEAETAARPILDLMVSYANQGMAFGFLMGFEASNPNIRGDHETVLTRLRLDCEADPTRTAMDFLLRYIP